MSSAVTSLIGTGLSAAGSIYEGRQASASADFEAKQMRLKAQEEFAAGAQASTEKRREGELAAGRARALAAASGGGTDNANVINIETGIQNKAEYSALLDLYTGKVRRSALRSEAQATKIAGKSALTGSYLKAGATVFSGISDAFAKAYPK